MWTVLDGFGRLAIVKAGICSAWCAVWPERVAFGWSSLVCVCASLPLILVELSVVCTVCHDFFNSLIVCFLSQIWAELLSAHVIEPY